ncbi:MAG: hypothetical protein HYU36_09280 [Planctomycetes bacterium]|nr:hypothetical protein [Planctomycetota bacterium]
MARQKHREVSKARRTAGATDPVYSQFEEQAKRVTPENRGEMMLWIKRESCRLLDEPEFAEYRPDGVQALETLLRELEWFQDGVLSADETERWLYCHEVQRSVLDLFFSPEQLVRISNCLLKYSRRVHAAGPLTPEARDRILWAGMFIVNQDGGMRREQWSLLRKVFGSARAGVSVPGESKDSLRQALALYEQYEAMGDESPILKWLYGGGKTPVPRTPPIDPEQGKLLNELSHAVTEGQVRVEIFEPLELESLFDPLLAFGLHEPHGNGEHMHTARINLEQKVRTFLWGYRQSSRWGHLATLIGVMASDAALSLDLKQRHWAPHFRAVVETLDSFYRGSHPFLGRAAIFQAQRVIVQFLREAQEKKAE